MGISLKKLLKWTLRISIGFIALLTLTVGILAVMFSSWKAGIIEAREQDPDRQIIRTARGNIEVAVVGQGVPLLSLHGTPGGYDQSLVGVRSMPENAPENTKTIAVSRPGYRGTPLSSGETFEAQADLFAALLDALGIDRVVVFAASGGGHAALQFVIRHPDRTMGMILYAPEIKSDPDVIVGPDGPVMDTAMQITMAEFGMWLLGERMAGVLMKDFDPEDPVQQAMMNTTITSMIPWGGGDAGRRNDLAQRMNPEIDNWPLEDIRVPILILHGNADENSPFEVSQEASLRIPNAELIAFDGGDHYIIVSRHDEVEGHIRRFTQAVAADN